MEYIKVDNLSKAFLPLFHFGDLLRFNSRGKKPVAALKNVSFSLNPGQCLAILGPNGAGKTTLLKILSALIIPDSGIITINNCRLGIDDDKIKSFISLVSSQERSFYWRLSGRQNLEFFAAIYGLGEKAAKNRSEQYLNFFQISSREQHKRFDLYSTGIKQKFSLIRALLNDPQILLLDEPTKSLDYPAAVQVRSFIRENLVKEQKKTVVFTTHQLDEACDFADLFMVLHQGKVFAFGTLAELKRKIHNPAATLGEVFLKLTQADQT